MPIKLFLVDDHQMFLDGLCSIFEDDSDIEVVGMAIDGFEALETLQGDLQVDIVITDINMPDMNGIELMHNINDKGIDVDVLCLSMFNDIDYINKMIKSGARGYLVKNTNREKLVDAVKTIYNTDEIVYSQDVQESIVKDHLKSNSKLSSDLFGKKEIPEFTRRERQLINEIYSGKSNSEIAEILDLSYHTVTTHRRNIYHKMKVNSYSSFKEYVEKYDLVINP